MKLLTCLLLFSSVSGYADLNIPSRLPDGTYVKECWGSSVYRNPEKTEIMRTSYLSSGTATYISNGDTTVIREKLESVDNGKEFTVEEITTSIYEKVGENFRETARNVSKSTYDGIVDEYTTSYAREFSVISNIFEVNINVKVEEESYVPGVGESKIEFLKDGRIVMQNYIREKVMRPGTKLSDGTETLPRETFQSSSTCILTLKK